MKHRQAFTLAETLFAMAILAFTVLTIVGMMPGGLANLQAAERREAEARIYQTLATEYQTKAWKELRSLTRSAPFYFDQSGLPLASLEDATAFAAQVEKVPSALLMPGESTANPALLHLRISITHQPRNSRALNTSLKANGLRREFGVLIVNMEAAK